MTAPAPEVLTLAETAEVLRINVVSLRKMLREGRCTLPVRKIGGVTRVSRVALDAYLAQGDRPTGDAA